MIQDHRPYTNENEVVDDSLLTELSFDDVDSVMNWIIENITPAKDILAGWTSYGLKHLLEHDTGVYLTNNQFKDAMMLCGYRSVNDYELNWRYRIRLTKEQRVNPSPFYHWVADYCLKEDSPEGDFARDMVDDITFPKVADGRLILDYLRGHGACTGAIEAFKRLWKEFNREGVDHIPRHPYYLLMEA